MTSIFDNAFYLLEYWGLSDVLLPFFLVFTVSFAVLQKAKIFGEDRRYNVIVALVLALSVVIPHSLNYYSEGSDVVNIINGALPNVSLFLVMIVMGLLLLGILSPRIKWGGGTFGGILVLIAAIVVVGIFGSSAGWWEATGGWNWLNDSDVQATIIIIAIFAIIVWVVTKPTEKTEGERLMKQVGDWFK